MQCVLCMCSILKTPFVCIINYKSAFRCSTLLTSLFPLMPPHLPVSTTSVTHASLTAPSSTCHPSFLSPSVSHTPSLSLTCQSEGINSSETLLALLGRLQWMIFALTNALGTHTVVQHIYTCWRTHPSSHAAILSASTHSLCISPFTCSVFESHAQTHTEPNKTTGLIDQWHECQTVQKSTRLHSLALSIKRHLSRKQSHYRALNLCTLSVSLGECVPFSVHLYVSAAATCMLQAHWIFFLHLIFIICNSFLFVPVSPSSPPVCTLLLQKHSRAIFLFFESSHCSFIFI